MNDSNEKSNKKRAAPEDDEGDEKQSESGAGSNDEDNKQKIKKQRVKEEVPNDLSEKFFRILFRQNNGKLPQKGLLHALKDFLTKNKKETFDAIKKYCVLEKEFNGNTYYVFNDPRKKKPLETQK